MIRALLKEARIRWYAHKLAKYGAMKRSTKARADKLAGGRRIREELGMPPAKGLEA